MTDRPPPLVAVLLATYNGGAWLQEQINTLLAQQKVHVCVYASDDGSSDDTAAILRRYQHSVLRQLPPLPERMGNANRNFLRLVHDAEIGDADFVAFADQDDLWHPDKLGRAVAELERTGAQAYSGDVVAFWPDGRRKVLVKSQPQRRFDYLFESAGPGCTFVLTRAAFEILRAWVCADYARLGEAHVHDWLFYAFGRVRGWHWHIDSRPAMDYRQHDRNEIGANVGARAARRRLGLLRDGSFRRNAVQIAAFAGDTSWVSRALQRMTPFDRLRLAFAFRSLRRRGRDALMMIIFAFVTK